MLSPSIINKNSNGERGHPCLSPPVLLKNEVGGPLIKTKKFVDETHAVIHVITCLGRPI